ncbi:serine protease snake-like [Achroia grisella]|uniref:serine protease snake-like n=1 Tax=Achroia grisella TaxID=688607 RepID=UPI0027D330F3|nr:serine protease snake-like [Achroia grisella]XP_059050111.1 serine protease snake-like [Achroia grisella]
MECTMWLQSFLYIFIFINLIIADVGDECVPNNQIADGICTLINNCEVAIRSIKNKNYHSFERCGFSGYTEIVCCPHTTDKFGPQLPDDIQNSQRIADRECTKILKSKIVPLGQYIIGGDVSALGEFAHMVALGFDRGEGYIFDCGGALVSNTYAITAAHCVVTKDMIEPSIVRGGVVEIGGKNFNEETDIRIRNVISHPEYTRRQKYHDIALLRLEKPAKFSSTLNAICLYTSGEDPDRDLTITGWGKTSTSRDVRSDVLLKAKVSIVSREKCSKNYTSDKWRKLPNGITSGQLCAGDTEGLHDTCQGDSGGPLQLTEPIYRLVGITSFGSGCGTPVPGVYTRISHYLDWIESIVCTITANRCQ